MKNNELSKVQNLVIGGISSLSMISVYVGGVHLSRNMKSNHIPVLIGGTILSYITPYITYPILKKVLKKQNYKRNGSD